MTYRGVTGQIRLLGDTESFQAANIKTLKDGYGIISQVVCSGSDLPRM